MEFHNSICIRAGVQGLNPRRKGRDFRHIFPSRFLLLGVVLNRVWCAGSNNLIIRSVNVKVSTLIAKLIPGGSKLGDPNLRSSSVNLGLLLFLPQNHSRVVVSLEWE